MKELFFAHWLVFSVNFFMFVAEKLIDLILSVFNILVACCARYLAANVFGTTI